MPQRTVPYPRELMIRSTLTILIPCLLAACGGGGGGGSTGGTTSGTGGGTVSGTGGGTIPADKTSPSVGDFYTYKMTGYLLLNGKREDFEPAYDTDMTTAVAGGIATVKTFFGNQYTGWFNDSATLTGTYQGGTKASCRTTYADGAYGPPAKLALNVSWDNSTSYTRDCGGIYPINASKLASKGSVVAIESITVAAGTFQAYKLAATVSEESVPGYYNVPDWSLASRSTSKLTSWIDIDTGVELKRAIEKAMPLVDSYNYSWSRELIGLSHANSGRQVLLVQRFAGTSWQGSYSGKLSGDCTAVVSSDGKIDASCTEGASTVKSLSPEGTINNSGQVSLTLPAGGRNAPTFTGKAESLTKISGTWTDGTGATGTWVFTRDF